MEYSTKIASINLNTREKATTSLSGYHHQVKNIDLSKLKQDPI